MSDQNSMTDTVEVETSALMRLLNDVKPMASTDATLSMINSIAFEFAGTDLIAIATDRYVLGAARLDVGKEIVQPPRMVSLADIDLVMKIFRPSSKGANPLLRLQFGEESLAVETAMTLDGRPTQSIAVPWLLHTVVSWRRILDGTREDGERQSVSAFNPDLLALFGKVNRSGEPMHVWPATAATRPWRVTIGDHFTGLIMPVRISDYGTQEWVPSAVNTAQPLPDKKRRQRKTEAAA